MANSGKFKISTFTFEEFLWHGFSILANKSCSGFLNIWQAFCKISELDLDWRPKTTKYIPDAKQYRIDKRAYLKVLIDITIFECSVEGLCTFCFNKVGCLPL